MKQLETLRGAVRLAISENKLPRSTNVDQMVLTGMSTSVLIRFYEGYFGPKLKENMEKAGKLRRENRAEYDRQLAENAKNLNDLNGIAPTLRLWEALTSTDFALGLALTRADATTRRDGAADFKTDLLDPAFTTTRTIDSLGAVASRNGVRLADLFLQRRAEASNLQYTSFTVSDGHYMVDNWELGLNFTNELKDKDQFGLLQDAAYQMGVAARRSRALTVLDAAIRKAPRLILPDAALGPNIANLEAVVTEMSDFEYGGLTYSQTVTDVFTSGAWASILATTINQASIPVVTGNSMTFRPNVAYQNVTPHNEQIMTQAPWADYPGLDRKTWLAVDRDARPFEFATKRGWESGPKTLVEVPATVDIDLGSFDNELFRIKVVDYAGADVAAPNGVLLIPGSPTAPETWEG